MEALTGILKILLIGIITPLGAALVVWELAQAILGRPAHRERAAAETQSGEEQE